MSRNIIEKSSTWGVKSSMIRESSVLEEVSRDLLNALIERIEVGERAVEIGVKTQEIRIIFKYVACL